MEGPKKRVDTRTPRIVLFTLLGLIALSAMCSGVGYWQLRKWQQEPSWRERQAMADDEWNRAHAPPPDPLASPPRDYRYHRDLLARFTVTSVTGDLPAVHAGTECQFAVQHFDTVPDDRACHAEIDCGNGLVLHGGGASDGRLRCSVFTREPPAVTGTDDAPTSADGDPTLAIDSAAHTFTITDDAAGAHGALTLTGTFEVRPGPFWN